MIGSASGNGKTTLARALAERLGVPCVELDALVHGPGWTETPDDVLRARVEPLVASDGWVIDGAYRWNALIPWALRAHVRRRRVYPRALAPYRVVRLRSVDEVRAFVARADA